jgi:hypothetical protein
MHKTICRKSLSLLLAIVLTIAGLAVVIPTKAYAGSQFITDIFATPYSTTKVRVAFHYGKDSSEDSRQELLVDVMTRSGSTLQKVTTYNFNIPYSTDPRGDYSCVIGGLESETQYFIRIKGSAGWYDDVNVAEHYYYSDLFPVTTPAPAAPVLDALELKGITATSVRLQASLVSTGTGFPFDPANPVWNPSGELLREQLVIYKAADDSGGTLQADSPYAVAYVGPQSWSDNDNIVRYSELFSGLEPGTAYVAQASISNIHTPPTLVILQSCISRPTAFHRLPLTRYRPIRPQLTSMPTSRWMRAIQCRALPYMPRPAAVRLSQSIRRSLSAV